MLNKIPCPLPDVLPGNRLIPVQEQLLRPEDLQLNQTVLRGEGIQEIGPQLVRRVLLLIHRVHCLILLQTNQDDGKRGCHRDQRENQAVSAKQDKHRDHGSESGDQNNHRPEARIESSVDKLKRPPNPHLFLAPLLTNRRNPVHRFHEIPHHLLLYSGVEPGSLIGNRGRDQPDCQQGGNPSRDIGKARGQPCVCGQNLCQDSNDLSGQPYLQGIQESPQNIDGKQKDRQKPAGGKAVP